MFHIVKASYIFVKSVEFSENVSLFKTIIFRKKNFSAKLNKERELTKTFFIYIVIKDPKRDWRLELLGC